jgi:hypothetical protein
MGSRRSARARKARTAYPCFCEAKNCRGYVH